MRIELRHEALAEPPHDAGGLDAVLVVLEPLLGREAGHTDVVRRLAVALRVAQIHHVNGMVMLWSAERRSWRVQRTRPTC